MRLKGDLHVSTVLPPRTVLLDAVALTPRARATPLSIVRVLETMYEGHGDERLGDNVASNDS